MNHRIFGLDILRAIAIICVLLAHTYFIFTDILAHEVSYFFGFIGVEIFFVLSGFLIGGILTKQYSKKEFGTFHELTIFWMRRWFRTLPTYYLMLLIYLLIFIKFHDSGNANLWSYAFFLQTTVSTNPHPFFFTVAWSLCVEEWFYLSFPLVILAFNRIIIKTIGEDKNNYAILCAVFTYVFGCLITRIYFSGYQNFTWETNFRKPMLLRLDSIAIGVLFAYIRHQFPLYWQKKKSSTLYLGVLLFILINVYYLFDFLIYKNESWLIKTVLFTAFSLSIGLMLPYFENIKSASNSSLSKSIIKISLYSYSIYLIHEFFIIIFCGNLLKKVIEINPPIQTVLIWICSIYFSELLYRYFEKPMTDLRDKYGYTID
jgi:peptidoglycan/LPS O-acetylase OafA/YrhL